MGGAGGVAMYRGSRSWPSWFACNIAFIIGIATHFLLDSVPHSEYDGLTIFQLPLYAILVPEVLVTSFLIFLFGCSPVNVRRNVLIGLAAFGGALPDCILIGSQLVFRHGMPTLLWQLNQFHKYCHTTYPSLPMGWGIAMQLVVMFAGMTVLSRVPD